MTAQLRVLKTVTFYTQLVDTRSQAQRTRALSARRKGRNAMQSGYKATLFTAFRTGNRR